MPRITDIIATVTNAWLKPGDQVPLTAVCNPDGSVLAAGGGGSANQYPGADYATAGKQDTLITATGADPASPVVPNAGTGLRGWLATIAGQGKLGAAATSAASPVVIASDDAAFGAPAAAAWGGSGSGTLISILKAVYAACTASTPAGTNVIGYTSMRSVGTSRSATVGTSAGNLMAANAARQGWKVKNDTAGDIWINFDATATAAPGGGNIKIPAGAYLASEPGFVETGAMSAIGSAAGLAITAREH